jgi:hypothetical protein
MTASIVNSRESIVQLFVPILSTGLNKPVTVTTGFIQMDAIAMPTTSTPAKPPAVLKAIVAGGEVQVVRRHPVTLTEGYIFATHELHLEERFTVAAAN